MHAYCSATAAAAVCSPLMRGSQALTMPGTHSKLDQQQQQQQQNLPEHANHHSVAAAAAGSSTPTSEGWVQGSGLGHARVQGWEMSRKDEQDMICAKW
jgi:hypothetical protein